MTDPRDFDPDGPASIEDGLYGLGHAPEGARVHLLPVPFEATTSYGGGTAEGPAAILEASLQVDLHDIDGGRVWEQGIVMLPEDPEIRRLNALLDLLGQAIEVHIAGVAFPASTGDTNLCLGQIFFAQTNSIEHGLSGGLRLILR